MMATGTPHLPGRAVVVGCRTIFSDIPAMLCADPLAGAIADPAAATATIYYCVYSQVAWVLHADMCRGRLTKTPAAADLLLLQGNLEKLLAKAESKFSSRVSFWCYGGGVDNVVAETSA